MPVSGGRLGVNDPPPAAMTTTLAIELRTGVGRESEARVGQALERVDALAEMQLGAEWLDLLQQPIGQLLAGDDWQAGDVVDGLFGVELGTLAARLVENIDDVRLDVDEPKLEHGEEAHRPAPMTTASVSMGDATEGELASMLIVDP